MTSTSSVWSRPSMSYSMRTSGNWTWPWSSHGRSCSSAQSRISSGSRSGRPSLSSRSRFRSCRNSWYSALRSFSRTTRWMFAPSSRRRSASSDVGAIDLGVVLQLARLLDAVVERLAVGRVLVPAPRFEQVASLLGQRDDGRVAVETDRLARALNRGDATARHGAGRAACRTCRGGRGQGRRGRRRPWSACDSRSRGACSRGRGY